MEGVSGFGGVGDDPSDSRDLPLDPKIFAKLMKKALGEEVNEASDEDEDIEDDEFYGMGSDDVDDEEGSELEPGSKESLRRLMKQMDLELGSMGIKGMLFVTLNRPT